MPTIIEQIQRDAVSSDVAVSALLRRLKVAAVKLGLGPVEKWVEYELNGYAQDVPDYRVVHGLPMARHPFRGWEQIGGHVEGINSRRVAQSIASLEELTAAVSANGEATIHFPYTDRLVARLNESNGTEGWPAALQVDRSAIAAILDRVRNLVLDWALDMEKAGILGNEFSFTVDDKERARAVPMTINIGSIGNFAGNLGSGNSAGDIALNATDIDQVKELIAQLTPSIAQIPLPATQEKSLRNAIEKLNTEVVQEKPKAAIIRGFLADLRNALAGAAGNLIAMGAIAKIDAIMATSSITM